MTSVRESALHMSRSALTAAAVKRLTADDVRNRDFQFWEVSSSCAEDAGADGTGSNVFLDGSVCATMSLLSRSSAVIPGDPSAPPPPPLPPKLGSDTESPGSADPPSPWWFGRDTEPRA